jgi:carboxyl-terminal processing protease
MKVRYTPERVSNRSSWRGLGAVLALFLALGAFFSGWHLGHGFDEGQQMANVFNFWNQPPITEEVVSTSDKPDLEEFWEVWELLEEKFVTSSTTVVSSQERIQGAIEGLVESYDDPYTVFLPPAESKAFTEDVSGEFGGVGMEVGLRNNLITIIAPLPETPAAAAGLMPGDVIISINGTSTEDMRLDEAVRLIRGPRGTVVVLEIYREGETEFLVVPVTRDRIEIPTVKSESREDAFYIALYSFNAISEQKVFDALRDFRTSDHEKLIIDVRGNPGGFLESAVGIAGYFLPAGKVVVEEQFGSGQKGTSYRSRGRLVGDFNPENLVVLVDGGSASASEILAGALRDHGYATIIGSQTFGKGSVQELIELDSGSALKVTIARWLTPAGTSISEGGVTPDIVIERTTAQALEDIDPQLEAAEAFLRGESVASEDFLSSLMSSSTADGV